MAKRRPSGDGMVRKRDDGRWEGRIVVGHKENGDSIFRYISAPTQKELSAKLRQLTESYKGVDLTEESNMTLSVWLDKWLDEYMAATLRPSTLNGYRRSLELHVKPYLGNKALTKITAADLRSLYRTLQETGRVQPREGQSPGLSGRTVHGIHTTLHHALKTAMEQNLIPNNPAAEVDPPKFTGAPMKILTEAQLESFMRAIEKDEFWHDLFYTAVTTGLRRGEICALRWEDFDAKQGTLHVRRTLHKEKGRPYTTGDTKTYAGTRKIVLPPSTAQLLRERKEAALAEWVFPNPFKLDQPISPSTAYNRLKALLKEARLPNIRFHDIRHTFATHALSSGVDAKTLAGILGHTKASFTLDTYTHTTGDMQKRAAEIVGGFLTDYLGEEMKPWQNSESMAAEASA
ncbi:Site-specific recombinase XerD [Oscillibacter sp. PC13]|uniref:tyrosine-type recombinase/integrase n=1 Tax=Oscillibacter sp. PC13 TaxID=1855299 RepID=UPI0008E6DE1B|nr:site-specific integrase [Oscillibacter sp. PC13]SFP85751.1 Site-specific recombinase XerD [Oscillibacter sp. PC13]